MTLTIGNHGTPGSLGAVPALPGGAAAQQPAAKVPAAVPEPAQPQPQQPPQPAQLHKAVESLKQLVEAKAPNRLAFSVDEDTGRSIVKITDAETGDLIRQIPAEEMLEIARSLDKMQGVLLQQKA